MNVFREDFERIPEHDTWADHKAEARKQDREDSHDGFGWCARRAADRWEWQMDEGWAS